MNEAVDVSCPVCHAAAGEPCRALDFVRLPGVHVERSATTPLFDALTAEASEAVAS